MSSRYLNPKRIRGINVPGLLTLMRREVERFLTVYLQTIVAPMITTLLFYAIFALAFGGIARKIGDVPFLTFLAPGLIMMTMVQNAFANTSSSLMIAKIQGNIVDMLLPPLSNLELMTGWLFGALCRGLAVGIVTSIVIYLFVDLQIHSLWGVLTFAVLGNIMLGGLGLAGGIWAEKFDHIASVTNFIVTPLTFLSGTFYSMESLPKAWQVIATYNPFFYMIDGFRSGFIGQADSNIWTGIGVLIAVNVVIMGVILRMLQTGYKIKS